MHQDERKRNITKVRYLTDVKDSVTEAGGGKEAIVSLVLSYPLADSQVQDQGPSRLKLPLDINFSLGKRTHPWSSVAQKNTQTSDLDNTKDPSLTRLKNATSQLL